MGKASEGAEMINPLDSTDIFSLELMNPNPVSSKTKDGPKYRVSFEMHKDDWQMFMDANTNGMILEMEGRVVEKHDAVVVDIKKGGPLSIEAAQWCNREGPDEYAQRNGFNHFKAMIYSNCGIKSRRELDHDKEAAIQWTLLKHRYASRPEL